MSLDIQVYTKNLSDELIPKIVERLNDYEMNVEIYPNFSFKDHSGFLPFKFQLTNTKFEKLKGKTLVSGFELYTDSFDLNAEKKKLNPKQNFLSNVFGKKQQTYFGNAEIDERLKKCNQVVSFIWHASDSFEVRFVSLACAILTELTDGVCCYPADNIWYDNKNIVQNMFNEVKGYESSLSDNDLQYHLFEGW
jgi:hypothetical protein